MKKLVYFLAVLFFINITIGCAGFKMGWNLSKVAGHYQVIDVKSENPGYDRMLNLIDFFPQLEGFIQKNGMPQVIQEMESESTYKLRLFYLNQNVVYLFEQKNWNPVSLYYSDSTQIDDYEKEIIARKTEMNKATE